MFPPHARTPGPGEFPRVSGSDLLLSDAHPRPLRLPEAGRGRRAWAALPECRAWRRAWPEPPARLAPSPPSWGPGEEWSTWGGAGLARGRRGPAEQPPGPESTASAGSSSPGWTSLTIQAWVFPQRPRSPLCASGRCTRRAGAQGVSACRPRTRVRPPATAPMSLPRAPPSGPARPRWGRMGDGARSLLQLLPPRARRPGLAAARASPTATQGRGRLREGKKWGSGRSVRTLTGLWPPGPTSRFSCGAARGPVASDRPSTRRAASATDSAPSAGWVTRARGHLHFPAGLDWMPPAQADQEASDESGSQGQRGGWDPPQSRGGAQLCSPQGPGHVTMAKPLGAQTSRVLAWETGVISAPGQSGQSAPPANNTSRARWLKREICSLTVWELEVQDQSVARAGPSRGCEGESAPGGHRALAFRLLSQGLFICYLGRPSGPAPPWWPVLVLTGH